MLDDTVEQSKVMAVGGREYIKGNVGRGDVFSGFDKGNTAPFRNNTTPGGRGNNGKICSYCGKTGHTVDTCYIKYGFPPHFKFTKQNCNQSFANVITHDDEKESESLKGNLGHHHSGSTEEQYQGLIALLQQSQTSSRSHVTNQVSATPGSSCDAAQNVFFLILIMLSMMF
ncbi:hypothetical protein SESBI_21720 [Sesbania bispinosa]|nr:hypothetical protein SESBI_21720 [Sesbania bispinosa]